MFIVVTGFLKLFWRQHYRMYKILSWVLWTKNHNFCIPIQPSDKNTWIGWQWIYFLDFFEIFLISCIALQYFTCEGQTMIVFVLFERYSLLAGSFKQISKYYYTIIWSKRLGQVTNSSVMSSSTSIGSFHLRPVQIPQKARSTIS